jgi:hypothetical protein
MERFLNAIYYNNSNAAFFFVTFLQVNSEFMRITTMPLQTKFMAQLDRYSADLTKLFSKRAGAAGKKIRHIMERTAQVYELCQLLVGTVRA